MEAFQNPGHSQYHRPAPATYHGPPAASFPPPGPRPMARPSRFGEPPLSQSREYISPDPSPLEAGYPSPRGDVGHLPWLGEEQNWRRRMTTGGPIVDKHEREPHWNPTYMTQPKKQGRKKVDGKQATFLTKLYGILNEPETQQIIRWDDSGEVIIIEKPEELADKILPLVYRQSRFASFSRQLNIYGFMRKVSLRNVDGGIFDPDASTWSHPFLRRESSQADIEGFKRRVPPRPSQSARRRTSQQLQDDGVSPDSSSDAGSYQGSPPDAHQHRLLTDLDEDRAAAFPYPAVHMSHSSPISLTSYDSHMYHRRMSGLDVPGMQGKAQGVPAEVTGDLPTLFAFHQNGPGMIPQSAPANTGHFDLPVRVEQQHLRTRSVQGEPPSATLFSPISHIAQPAWSSEGAEPVLRGGAVEAPRYDTNDASTWVRRGLTDLAGNPIIIPAANRFGLLPSSVPNDFAPSSLVHHGLNVDTTTSFAAALSDDSPSSAMPQTVSPGIYQMGLSMQNYRPAYVSPQRPGLSQPSTVGTTRQGRQPSVGNSPYSPRMKPPSALGHGVRGMSWRNESKGSEGRDEGYEGLPSASLDEWAGGPFGGVLEAQHNAAETGRCSNS